jgi:hypothetical protein
MKKYLFICLLSSINTFAQIIGINSIDRGIKITPTGIVGRMNNQPISTTNTALGESSLLAAGTVTNNTALGFIALQNIGNNFPNNYNGNNNTAIGASALLQINQGYDNSGFGTNALGGFSGNATGSMNTAFGRTTLSSNNLGNKNAAFGFASLLYNENGNDNSAFGTFAANGNTNSNSLSAFGNSSLQFHTVGDNNSAFGSSSMLNDESGFDNTALGNNALTNNKSGTLNVAFGNASMYLNKTGSSNTAFGYYSLLNNNGQSNVVVGNTSFDQNTTGSTTVAIGIYALHTNLIGTGNIAIGAYAGYFETGSNKLYIDANLVPFNGILTLIGGDMTARKVCVACNMSLTGTNDFNTRTEAFQVQGAAFKTSGNGTWQFSSDRRLKRNIISLNQHDMLEKVISLQGVNYNLIASPEQGMQYGFIAQELRKIFPTKVYENKSGFLSASYGDFVPMFVEAIKALNERVERLNENKPDIKALTASVERMEALSK